VTRAAVVMVAAAALVACASPPAPGRADRGRALFSSTALSDARGNTFTCATCHDVAPAGEGGEIKTGAPLAGATLRPSFWGGQEDDLLAAIEDCRAYFMGAGARLDTDSPDAEALAAFLVSLEPGDPTPAPFTFVDAIEELPRGDARAGASLIARSCARCHGEPHTGVGRTVPAAPILPEGPIAAHADYGPRSIRLVFTEKIRHGSFRGYPGDMPPYAAERLTDQDVSDVLESLGVLGL
jgi:thiosulfate dehydrogenase